MCPSGPMRTWSHPGARAFMLFTSLIHFTYSLKSTSSTLTSSEVLESNTEKDLDELNDESPLSLIEEEGEMSMFENIQGSGEVEHTPPGLGDPS